jgi:CRISPR-associated protein Cas5t
MEVNVIDIRSWTASFRCPALISGIQLTLEVPPISTVLGLINAAAGRYLEHHKLLIGYYFEYAAKAVDVETIYMIENNSQGRATNNARSNVIRREFLFDVLLRIYTPDKTIIEYLKKPVFPILLGRSNDLATADIATICTKSLRHIQNADSLSGQVIPFFKNNLPGTIQALPKYFSNEIPRQNLGTEPYSVINCHNRVKSNLAAYRDSDKGLDIYFHEIDVSKM